MKCSCLKMVIKKWERMRNSGCKGRIKKDATLKKISKNYFQNSLVKRSNPWQAYCALNLHVN